MFWDKGDEQYSGDSSYRFVDKLIMADSRKLLVVSPYIGNSYAKLLISEARRKKVYVVTSQSSLEYENSVLKGIPEIGAMKRYLKPMAYFSVITAFAVYFNLSYFVYPLIAIVLVFVALTYLTYRKTRSNFLLKVSREKFVHEKLYINDREAIVGSANLTFSGMHKNVEHIQMIRDMKKRDALEDHFKKLWSSIG
ncbi:MAG TPA: phospholipase D-like domain-containing protein [Candidatus Baltobacteraceae bacterium]|nr:phospholipase D-like domain-containing protein [Candidatus Baltobacteraceae bacterium]